MTTKKIYPNAAIVSFPPPAATCQCEHAGHFTNSGVHAYGATRLDVTPVKTSGGTFQLCATCVDECAPPALEPGTRAYAEQGE